MRDDARAERGPFAAAVKYMLIPQPDDYMQADTGVIEVLGRRFVRNAKRPAVFPKEDEGGGRLWRWDSHD